MANTAELDATDKKVLQALSENARASLSVIAKKARCSKQVAAYRISNLLKKGIISQFITIFNWQMLGYTSFRLYIRLANIKPAEQVKMIETLKSFRGVYFIGACEGKVDLLVRFLAKNPSEFQEIFDEFIGRFGSFILDKEVTIVTRDPFMATSPGRYLYGGEQINLERRKTTQTAKAISLGSLDWKIMAAIADSPRASFADLASTCGASPDVVAYRIKKLISNEIILNFKPILDTKKLGYEHHQVFLKLQNAKPSELDPFFRFYNTHQYVVFLMGCIGSWDVEIGFDARNIQHFHEQVLELKDKFGAIIKEYDTAVFFEQFYPNAVRNVFTGRRQ